MKQCLTQSREAFAQRNSGPKQPVRHNTSGQLLPVHGEGYLYLIGLLQAVLDCVIWQPVGSQRGPLVVPVKLGCGHGLQEIRHGRNGDRRDGVPADVRPSSWCNSGIETGARRSGRAFAAHSLAGSRTIGSVRRVPPAPQALLTALAQSSAVVRVHQASNQWP